jgi:FkbM family methyltransferase
LILRKALKIFLGWALVIFAVHSQESEWITVVKKNVTHHFVKFDESTDYFTSQVFQNWENETFDVFEQVQDPEGIALDIGAWIGTTSIWLSKHFKHVVAVECDRISLTCLEKNLEASKCHNVSICPQPVAATTGPVIFGPRGSRLNESISSIKEHATHVEDKLLRPVTLKKIIYDYVHSNSALTSKKISFIKCDIEGGEEQILEDILHFCYHNQCSTYLSFHLTWWLHHTIRDFEPLFAHFETGFTPSDLCTHLESNPFASILFKPIRAGEFPKKNIPAVIIGYNQVTYIKNMVDQLKKYTSDIIIIDNNSTFPPLLDYYRDDFHYTLLKMDANYGHSIYQDPWIQKLVGDTYLLTDPDLQFNSKLPDLFIADLLRISNYFKAGRVGFALAIDSDNLRTDVQFAGHSIQGWERQFWLHKLEYSPNAHMELYAAFIDTTFCLINKKYSDHHSIRVAGDYTCHHLPWYKDFRTHLQEGEYESYIQHNRSSNWFFAN